MREDGRRDLNDDLKRAAPQARRWLVKYGVLTGASLFVIITGSLYLVCRPRVSSFLDNYRMITLEEIHDHVHEAWGLEVETIAAGNPWETLDPRLARVPAVSTDSIRERWGLAEHGIAQQDERDQRDEQRRIPCACGQAPAKVKDQQQERDSRGEVCRRLKRPSVPADEAKDQAGPEQGGADS